LNESIVWFLIHTVIVVGVVMYLNWRNKNTGSSEPSARPARNFQDLQQLIRMRSKRLNEPLSETARPATFEDIIGQEEGIRALRAALCGPNPQHVIIYGPPGIGKTCAARLVLEEAKKREDSPFNDDSKFIEMDATCVRFDERAIADPLMGSVHDPIYQGAGALGSQGVPQPKPGAVSRAHCGILFLDEIGELHPMQMNKLLKVLEDRCVRFESAYYSPDNSNIPQHIHDIFQNGLPADFRLIGATTRRPEELPPALRSRCLELYFKSLGQTELELVAKGAAKRAGYTLSDAAANCCAQHSHSGRDAVNMVQLSCALAYDDKRTSVEEHDVQWVARTCNYMPRLQPHIISIDSIGKTNGLAVGSTGQGFVLEIECTAQKVLQDGHGTLQLNGIVDEEELELRERKLKRKSAARSSVENVLCAVRNCFHIDFRDHDISFNIPGGIPVDGPSAGIALAIALMSAITKKPVDHLLASTGEMTIYGQIKPVGGVREKIEAAILAGATRVLIPKDNWEEAFAAIKETKIIPVSSFEEAYALCFAQTETPKTTETSEHPKAAVSPAETETAASAAANG